MIGSAYHLTKSLGRPQQGRLSRWRAQANRILKDSRKLKGITDEELLERAKDVRWRAKTGIPLPSILEEVDRDRDALLLEGIQGEEGIVHRYLPPKSPPERLQGTPI